MNTVKNILFFGLLLAVLCGVYLSLSRRPQSSLPEGLGLDDTPKVKIEMGSPASAASNPPAGLDSSSIPALPAQPPGPPTPPASDIAQRSIRLTAARQTLRRHNPRGLRRSKYTPRHKFPTPQESAIPSTAKPVPRRHPPIFPPRPCPRRPPKDRKAKRISPLPPPKRSPDCHRRPRPNRRPRPRSIT